MRYAVALTLALVACSSTPEPAPPPVPVPSPEGACDAAGARLEALQCRAEDGSPYWRTPEGASFAEACQAAASDGRDWNPSCIAQIPTCDFVTRAYSGDWCGE